MVNQSGEYPKHMYDPIRYEVAEGYLIHELRKLLEGVGGNDTGLLERDIRNLKVSKELANPRDFWNGFHGVCMGFKLKIGLLYAITAENVVWEKRLIPLGSIHFGVELPQTLEISRGKLNAKTVKDFYNKGENEELREKYLKIAGGYFDNSPRGTDPIIAFEHEVEGKSMLLVNDGNGRLGRAVLSDRNEIETFVGRFSSDKIFHNTWVPTSLLMENLYYAKLAYERDDKNVFEKYMEIIMDIVSDSESGEYELLNRALTTKQPFRSDVLKLINKK